MKTRYGLPNRAIRKTAVIVAALASASSANALYFEFGDDAAWQLDWDTNISNTAQWRVAKQDDDQFAYKDLGGNDPIASLRRHTVLINANDGDNNFNRSLVQNKVGFVTEMDLAWRNYCLLYTSDAADE